MAFDPWAIPHGCERHEVAKQLNQLSPAQRKIVRSYVRSVEYGDMTLTKWIATEDVPSVAMSTWRKRADKGGNYWGTEESPNLLFRDAVAAYTTAWGRWQTEEEEKSVRKANRTIRLGAAKAADRLIDLIDNGEKDSDKLNAAKTVLDRASEETAEKSSVSVNPLSADTFAAMRQQAAKEAKEAEQRALEEWQSQKSN